MNSALSLPTFLGVLLLAGTASAQAPATGTAPAAPEPETAPAAPEPAAPEESAPNTATPPAPPPATNMAGVGTLPVFPSQADAAAAKKPPEMPAASRDVYSEDWWSHARPVLELHGYFRVRGELFHHFSLGRVDPPQSSIWPRPADNSYVDYSTGNRYGPQLCTPNETDSGSDDNAQSATEPCKDGTQAGANMRFRLNPELHISDNLRVISQIDLLDNLVLGSTPGGYGVMPADAGGYAVADRDGYAPIGFFDDTTAAPSAGRNGIRDSIIVKRAWAEYSTPIGEVRFGRMPNHWGLGMFLNSGDGYDDNYQSTIDRAQIIGGLKPLELYFSAAMDFPNDGATSDSVALPNPQPYDLGELDDVDQYTFSVARKKDPELERLALTKGSLVLNAGAMLIYRQQTLANDRFGTTATCGSPGAVDGAAAIGCVPGGLGYVRRGAHAWVPDLWLELKYKRFRFGAEAVTIQGSIENTANTQSPLTGDEEFTIREWGVATEIEQKLAEDRLRLAFNFGWASGDPDVDGLAPPINYSPGNPASLAQHGDQTISTFRFHPSYSVDLILFRNILSRVQGSYYFKPAVDYDFSHSPDGQRIGGGLSVIWSRASEFIQAPGHAHDLGIELDARLYYQSKDGSLNDTPDQMGGFFSKLEYGVLFPMAGMGYPDKQAAALNAVRRGAADTHIAQTLRLYLGVFF